ncbi:hypothetical protein BB560_003630 [Smittium megazygosporum]|uniref:histone acetyltransferase n=1 Tax=Smittium megazygosporum TaxID=133381 RepID=A0A2T9ZBD8_9FUNG|nr:hypothetical protein BB560_003630 [Smittium megazygosporum]
MFVAGLQTREYVLERKENNDHLSQDIENEKRQVVVYIEKVDSVGFGGTQGEIGYARALVIGYLTYLVEQKYENLTKEIMLYTYSKSQPEYLFANSKLNKAKKTLASNELNNWWRKTLETAWIYIYLKKKKIDSTSSSDGTEQKTKCARANVFVPNIDSSQLKWVKSKIKSKSSVRNINDSEGNSDDTRDGIICNNQEPFWEYGNPFSKYDRAVDVIPSFPDDPIARLLLKEENKDITVNELFEMLPFIEECGKGHQTAFFFMYFELNDLSNFVDKKEIHLGNNNLKFEKTQNELEIDNKEMEILEITLFDRSVDFSTFESSIYWTKEINLKISKYVNEQDLKTIGGKANEYERIKLAKKLVFEPLEQDQLKRKGKSEQLPNLLNSGLIKRKKKN